MRGGGGGKIEGIGPVDEVSTQCDFVDRSTMVVTVVVRPPWGPTPGF